jgi:hypothetical protein
MREQASASPAQAAANPGAARLAFSKWLAAIP